LLDLLLSLPARCREAYVRWSEEWNRSRHSTDCDVRTAQQRRIDLAQHGAAFLGASNTGCWSRVCASRCCNVHGMTVATRNVAQFQSTGVAVLNPWADQV
jgi:hypothetical protein